MDITKDFIKAKRPCTDGFRWFLRNHQLGSNYQPLLDDLVRAGRIEDACWLLTQFGPTDGVLELDELCDEAVVFAAVSRSMQSSGQAAKFAPVAASGPAGQSSPVRISALTEISAATVR